MSYTRHSLLSLFVTIAACGGPALGTSEPERPSGQSALMEKTFAGANKCNPKNHDRPFVIEWDATDMSSFESKAASDVVFVKYEGCDLHVLDACSNDSVKGSLGAYGAIDWTSGSVEKIDIANEGELFAKLPLGVNSLGGRVQGGEQFHMEYYVSGTRKATRGEIFASDLEKLPGCKGATHFVYAYNLGAFALGSRRDLKGEASATVWGIGAGAKQQSMSQAEKKGGVLTSCTGETAKETHTCKVPIRLTLREISTGENPDEVAHRAPETPDAFNLASKIDLRLKQDANAQARWEAATERFKAGDGKGCLRELDERDRLDRTAANLSTNPKSATAMYRAMCLMLVGQCDVGKAQLRRSLQAQSAHDVAPEQIDQMVDQQAISLCQGKLSPREELVRASRTLGAGNNVKKDVSTCARAWATVQRLAPTVEPKDDDDHPVKSAKELTITAHAAAGCLARAGDCAGAYAAFKQSIGPLTELNMRMAFAQSFKSCKGFVEAMPMSPRDQLVKSYNELSASMSKKTDAATCTKHFETLNRLSKTVKTRDSSDPELQLATMPDAGKTVYMYCLAAAGDCPRAFKLGAELYSQALAIMSPPQRKSMLEGMLPACKP